MSYKIPNHHSPHYSEHFIKTLMLFNYENLYKNNINLHKAWLNFNEKTGGGEDLYLFS